MARQTRRRALAGVALVATGLVVLSLVPLGSHEVLLISSTAFVSGVIIVLGISLIGNIPINKILLGLFVGGLYVFLFVVPISLLPLSPEISPIVLGFSLLALALIFVFHERRKGRVNRNGKRAESSTNQ